MPNARLVSAPPSVASGGAPGACSEKDLWANIWKVVESRSRDGKSSANSLSELSNRSCLSIEVYAGYRRRLNGKQPPPGGHTAMEVFTHIIKRRLVGKQPLPLNLAASCGSGQDSSRHKPMGAKPTTTTVRPVRTTPRGYYDRLGLRRDADAAEIRLAYRRQALATHPDKGGDSEYFHQVTAAFEELADASRRAAYDRNLDFFGSRDGLAPEGPMGAVAPPQDVLSDQQERPVYAGRREYGDARVLQEQLLVAPIRSWNKKINETADRILEALCNLLLSGAKEGSADAGLAELSFAAPWGDVCGGGERRGRVNGSAVEPRGGVNGEAAAAAGGKFIRRHKRGYIVQVAWASLSVSTAYTHSLAQAIDWQIALMSAQGEAQARLLGIHECGGALEPFTEEEWLRLLATEPSIRPIFRLVFRVGGQRGKVIQTPGVQNFRLALEFRRRFSAISGSARMEKARTSASSEATRDIRERRLRESKLRRAVLWEMQERQSAKDKARARTRGILDRPGGVPRRGNNRCQPAPVPAGVGVKRRHESSPTLNKRRETAAALSTPPKPQQVKDVCHRPSPLGSPTALTPAVVPPAAVTPPKPRKVNANGDVSRETPKTLLERIVDRTICGRSLNFESAAMPPQTPTSPTRGGRPRCSGQTDKVTGTKQPLELRPPATPLSRNGRRRGGGGVPSVTQLIKAKIAAGAAAGTSGALPLSHWFAVATAAGGG